MENKTFKKTAIVLLGGICFIAVVYLIHSNLREVPGSFISCSNGSFQATWYKEVYGNAFHIGCLYNNGQDICTCEVDNKTIKTFRPPFFLMWSEKSDCESDNCGRCWIDESEGQLVKYKKNDHEYYNCITTQRTGEQLIKQWCDAPSILDNEDGVKQFAREYCGWKLIERF